MDPNIIVLRLGADVVGDVEGSGPLTSVTSGDVFAVSFKRANFSHKRDALSHSTLNRDTSETFGVKLSEDIEAK